MRTAKILVDLALDKPFDYALPEHLANELMRGDRVKVPFGRSFRFGYILDFGEAEYAGTIKPIAERCPNGTRIPEKLVELGNWMAEYYVCAREHAIRTLLPAAVRSGRIKHKTELFIRATDEARAFIDAHLENKSTAARRTVLELLLRDGEQNKNSLAKRADISSGVFKTLLRDGLIESEERIVRKDLFDGAELIRTEKQSPTAEQNRALSLIFQMLEGRVASRVLLLHGATNSGKTEVYLQAIARALELGQSAIVLVPEIALTPQTVRRFRSRFGNEVSVLHSSLTDGERFSEWNKINDGQVKIAVGARSALFAPFRNLGLIIVDEEHESSYKQSESPRYSARDVAVMRGKLEGACVILGSATPSAESYHNALAGKYLLAEMPTPVNGARPPRIEVEDLRIESADREHASVFSKRLIEAVRDRLAAGEQTILFLNRRGYARQLTCEKCGYHAECSDCSVSYTYSKLHGTLSCHLCGTKIPAPEMCPSCNAPDIRRSGIGTEKIEAMTRGLFPGASVDRMDSDSMRSASDYEDALDRVRRGRTDILIGTQMIAKGLHFPNVTLVGILNADHSLLIPDFRAPERTFQLITQVAGRAGRGDAPGRVIVQTFDPQNETLEFAVQNDFKGFYKFDTEVREALGYPPFGHLIAIYFQSEDESAAMTAADAVAGFLRPAAHPEVRVVGPEPAPIERIKGKYRYMLLIRGSRLRNLRSVIRSALFSNLIPRNVDAYADVDAQSLM